MILLEQGTVVESIILKCGVKIVGGTIKSWSSTGCSLINSYGQVVKISSADEVVAVIYLSKDKNKDVPAKAKIDDDDNVTHKPGDIKSLTALKKLKAEQELEDAKTKLKQPEITQGPVEYASQFSILRKFKDNPQSKT